MLDRDAGAAHSPGMRVLPQSSLDLASTANPVDASEAVRIVRPAGGQTSPIVFASPHSGRDYSDDMQARTVLSLTQLRRSEDAYVDELIDFVPDFGAISIEAMCPRVFVDVNRGAWELDPGMFTDRLPAWVDTHSRRAVSGLGVVPRLGADGRNLYRRRFRFEEARDRVERFYEPYHAALASLLTETRQRFGLAILLDMHSMPAHSARGADFVLGDRFGVACDEGLIRRVESGLKDLGFVTQRNTPYAGGFTTEHYGEPKSGIHVLQIEINRGLYLDETRVRKSAGFDGFRSDLRSLFSDLLNCDWVSEFSS